MMQISRPSSPSVLTFSKETKLARNASVTLANVPTTGLHGILQPTGTAASNNAAVIPGPTKRHTTHGGHNVISHNSFMSRADDRDAMLSPHIRQAILDKGMERSFKYEPERVTCRKVDLMEVRDYPRIVSDRTKRHKAVYSCGFCADTKEVYRALGDPVLNSEALILQDPMHLDSNPFEQSYNEQLSEAQEDKVYFEKVAQGLERIAAVQPRRSNGQSYLKDKIAQSKARIHSVKFGISYMEICEQLDQTIRKEEEERVKRARSSRRSSFHANVGDGTKQVYYSGLLERALNGRTRAPTDGGDSIASKERQKSAGYGGAWSATRPASTKGKSTSATISPSHLNIPDSVSTTLKPINTTSLIPPSSSRLPLAPQHSIVQQQQQNSQPNSPTTKSQASMESQLGVIRERAAPDPIERLLQARDLINSEKDKITESLVKSLERADAERKVMSLRKLRAFDVGKNATVETDLRKMREKAVTADARFAAINRQPKVANQGTDFWLGH
ncbi:hypothetical protein SmJEL517_g01698 [Synchytrium microbalum]|uniref:Uncharacterized protein n=1 Tax=Synchytrium microbalum TaxID=1806994 RepID=A0A507CE61_9FUNG|nr:uncharacterized protein SmJEL517_g01698 [Synchytrium microbalum]TPX35865.1 hypothetical protein SmJEL517_g01698 [Synchytrium microbalum]